MKQSVCTSFSSLCQNAFSCHGETVATQAPSSWEWHRGRSDPGTTREVQSFIKRMLSYSRLRLSPRLCQGLVSVEQCKTFQLLSHFYHGHIHHYCFLSVVYLFFQPLLHSTSLTIWTAWALCLWSDFIYRSLWGCVCADSLTHICGNCVVAWCHYYFYFFHWVLSSLAFMKIGVKLPCCFTRLLLQSGKGHSSQGESVNGGAVFI